MIVEKKITANQDHAQQIEHLSRQNVEMSNTIRRMQTTIDQMKNANQDREDLETRIAALETENVNLRKRKRTAAEKEQDSIDISTQIGTIVSMMLAVVY